LDNSLAGLIILLILVLGFNFVPRLLPRLSRVQAEAHTTELRVMTFNVHYANRNASGIARLIQAEQPDLIAFQELTPDLAELLLPELESAYPYRAIA
jgi:endonuclease/exonuclease/phosphatase (EEP) superfamily protein YafD